MKLAVLVSGGRTGSDFFQSLLDGHSEILSLPGVFYFDEYLEQLKTNNISPAKLFLKMYENFFDSRLNKLERHHMLGKNKNEFYIVNKEKFLKHFNNSFKDTGNRETFEILKHLHLSYAYAKGESLYSKKLIFLHIHHWFRLSKLKFLNFDLFYTLRDPLVTLSSAFKNWILHKDSKHFSFKQLCFYYDRICNGIDYCNQFKFKNFYIIKLEDVHLNTKQILCNFLKLYKLKFENLLLDSTFHGKKWWGDSISQRFLNGININYKGKINEEFFSKKDISYLKSKMVKIYKKYYTDQLEKNYKKKYFYFPLKMEYQILKKNISFIMFLKFLYFSIKRYILLNKSFNYNYPKNISEI